MARTAQSAPPSKVRLSELATAFLNEYKGAIAETKNSVAIIRMIRHGLKVGSDGRYGLLLKQHHITIDQLTAFGVRIDKALDLEVRSHGGRLNLNLTQAYFDVICTGLAAEHFKAHVAKPTEAGAYGSILVIDPTKDTAQNADAELLQRID